MRFWLARFSVDCHLDERPVMSVATPFKYIRPFPFCPEDLSGTIDVHASYVDNLSLATVMAFAWNLETFTLTTSGSVTYTGLTADANGHYITLGPAASNVYTHVSQNAPDMMLGDTGSTSPVAIASFASVREPRERVCYPVTGVNGTLLSIGFEDATSSPDHFGFLFFVVGTDPVNTGKYRVYYRFSFRALDPGTQTVEILFKNESTAVGYTAWNSGTVSIGGISFSWYSYYAPGGATPTGTGSLSATSSFFTYP